MLAQTHRCKKPTTGLLSELPKPKKKKNPSLKSVLQEGDDIALAREMIHLGARLQVLGDETSLSYDRLSRLYHEIQGKSPPRGMLPFSPDWFLGWRVNVQATLFASIHNYIETHTGCSGTMALIKAYNLYKEQKAFHDDQGQPLLDFTRAWTLLRFMRSGLLTMTACSLCSMSFVTYPNEPASNFACPLCKPPPRIVSSHLSSKKAAQ